MRTIVTGCAGFIGSHLTDHLLSLGHTVYGIDDFSTGTRDNLNHIENKEFIFDRMDANHLDRNYFEWRNPAVVFHQAAIGSVPKSKLIPKEYFRRNVETFVNVALLCAEFKCKLIYASSSSVGGDTSGKLLSVYALTKSFDEKIAEVFGRVYGLESVGLRYFNVFGPRQRVNDPYAAVIPRWINGFLKTEVIEIYGDGEQTRDFTYVSDVVDANVAAFNYSAENSITAIDKIRGTTVFDVGAGRSQSLNDLMLILEKHIPNDKMMIKACPPKQGDIKHSRANTMFKLIDPQVSFEDGLIKTIEYFRSKQNGCLV